LVSVCQTMMLGTIPKIASIELLWELPKAAIFCF
jgi:hypothetical protein